MSRLFHGFDFRDFTCRRGHCWEAVEMLAEAFQCAETMVTHTAAHLAACLGQLIGVDPKNGVTLRASGKHAGWCIPSYNYV
jgi:hypothetical protein